jgi:nitrite reductase (NADH) small subunit
VGRHIIGNVGDLPQGARVVMTLENRSIGIFNVGGKYYALKNTCPHQAAPLCVGSIKGTTLPSAPGEYKYAREGEIIRCPWHGWEFDLTTGKSLFDPHKCLVKTYEVAVEEEQDLPSVETYQVQVEANKVVVYI